MPQDTSRISENVHPIGARYRDNIEKPANAVAKKAGGPVRSREGGNNG